MTVGAEPEKPARRAEIRLPYGKGTLTAAVPAGRLAGVLTACMPCGGDIVAQEALVREALAHPVGTEPLHRLAVGKRRVVLIASDHTRPVPSRLLVPPMLREIRRGNPEAEITILIATGCHRGTTREELREKFGPGIADTEKIVVHDCDDESNLVSLGRLPSGGELTINRLAAEADLLVSEGFIEPHFFAGFSGGRKSVLPGVASRRTVLYNHNSRFIADPRCRTGVTEGNPIHEDMRFAASAAGLAFILNVVLNSEKETVFAVAGEPEAAHRAGRAFLTDRCQTETEPADIVMTGNGGYPLDQNLYQAVKGMTAAEAAVRKGGAIIMAAASEDGLGGEAFYETFRRADDLEALMKRFLNTPPEQTYPDQWQAQILTRVLLHADVILISGLAERLVSDTQLVPAHSPEEALRIADGRLAERGIRNGTVLAIPDGVSVIVRSR